EFVATGAECAGRRVTQACDCSRRFGAGIDQVFGERADNAVAPGIDSAYPVGEAASGLDDAGGGCIDGGGDTATLGVENIFCGHVVVVAWKGSILQDTEVAPRRELTCRDAISNFDWPPLPPRHHRHMAVMQPIRLSF